MIVIINSTPYTTDAKTVADLAAEMQLPDSGVALAVNSMVVPRTEWAKTPVNESDDFFIIKAASGG